MAPLRSCRVQNYHSAHKSLALPSLVDRGELTTIVHRVATRARVQQGMMASGARDVAVAAQYFIEKKRTPQAQLCGGRRRVVVVIGIAGRHWQGQRRRAPRAGDDQVRTGKKNAVPLH